MCRLFGKNLPKWKVVAMLQHVLLSLESDALARALAQVLAAAADIEVRRLPAEEGRSRAVQGQVVDLAVLDDRADAKQLASWVQALNEVPERPDIVLLSGADDPRERAAWLAAGVSEVLPLVLGPELLGDAILSTLARRQALRESLAATEMRPAETTGRIEDFRSDTPAGYRLFEFAERVARTDSTALILGETGVGKEHLARALHAAGPRASGPFVAVNCGAIPESLLESELFGHERGAFTGATRSRRGLFELAHGGTLLLDEIGEMPGHLQVKLLRVLQEREVLRVGGERPIPVDVRVLAATNRVVAERDRGGLRDDLYFRVSVVTLEIPPLRERVGDLPEIARRLLLELAPRFGRSRVVIEPEALKVLARRAWPGNIRELRNALERALILGDGERLRAEDFQDSAPAPLEASTSAISMTEISPDLSEELEPARQRVIDDFERRYLAAMLREEKGRIGPTARRAGIAPRSLYAKMRRLGLAKEDFR
jgi:DNA-binding NtrC family response regulator